MAIQGSRAPYLHPIQGMASVATMPQLVYDWLDKKYKIGSLNNPRVCIRFTSSADIKWDPLTSTSEMALSELHVQVLCKTPIVHIDVRLKKTQTDIYIIEDFKSKQGVTYSESSILARLDPWDPLYFRKLGKYIKCKCPKPQLS